MNTAEAFKVIEDELERLRADAARLRGALEFTEWRLEWTLSPALKPTREFVCPFCNQEQEQGHASSCVRQAALGK